MKEAENWLGDLLQAKNGKLYLGGACVLLAAVVGLFSLFAYNRIQKQNAENEILIALRNSFPLDDYAEILDTEEIGMLPDGVQYIFDGELPMGEPSDFDLLSDAWWEKNVGSHGAPGDFEEFEKSITIKTDYTLQNAFLKRMTEADYFVVVDNANATVRNSLLEGTVRVYDTRDSGTVVVENCTFVTEKARRFAIGGMGITARFNLISSLNDGVLPTGGLTSNNLIEYNWFKGPGYRYEDNHMDGIQLWQEGNVVIRRNRFSGFHNSHILIKSDHEPRYGGEPIKNVLISENYFEDSGPKYYHLFVCEGSTDPGEYYLTRPQYITITNNCFESKKLHPIYSGLEKTESAMFVRSEEERDEGVRRQDAHPEVLELRQELGWSKTAVDARTWIVWSGNYYKSDGSEVPPHDGKANKDWYSLDKERNEFPLDQKASADFTVELIESSIGSSYLQWLLTNNTKEPIVYEVIVPGDTTARQKRMEPGENKLNSRKFPRENNLTIRWKDSTGMTQEMVAEGIDFVVEDITATFVKAPNDSYLDWEGDNPNPFTLKIDWSYEQSDKTGSIWFEAGAKKNFRTPKGDGDLILTWQDEYGNNKSLNVLHDGSKKPDDENSVKPEDMISISFVEKTASTDYLNWTVTNHTQEPLTYYANLSDGAEKKMMAQPGDNLYKAAKVPGDNTLYVRWQSAAGKEASLMLFTLDNTYIAPDASFDKIINSYHDWNVTNSNSFTVNYAWSILETGQKGQKAAAPGSIQLRIPNPPEGTYTLTLSWTDEFGVLREANFHYGEAEATPTTTPTPTAAPSASAAPTPTSVPEASVTPTETPKATPETTQPQDTPSEPTVASEEDVERPPG